MRLLLQASVLIAAEMFCAGEASLFLNIPVQ